MLEVVYNVYILLTLWLLLCALRDSALLYVHNMMVSIRLIGDGEPRNATSTFTHLIFELYALDSR